MLVGLGEIARFPKPRDDLCIRGDGGKRVNCLGRAIGGGLDQGYALSFLPTGLAFPASVALAGRQEVPRAQPQLFPGRRGLARMRAAG